MQQEEFGKIEDIFKDHGLKAIVAPGAITAAVMIPLVESEGKLHILFELRNSKIQQGGEVCFPGGRVEPGEHRKKQRCGKRLRN